jgi:hypothetical protein
MTDMTPTPPQFWAESADAAGTVLTYAVRGGKSFYLLIALGAAAVLFCASVLLRWLTAGDLTGAGFVFLLLPVAGIVFGAHCLDVALRAKTEYVLGSAELDYRRHALFGARPMRISRASIVEIFQQWTPPGQSAPSGSPGTWATLIRYHAEASKKPKEFAFDGLGTPEEARWLGPLLTRWADAPLRKDVAASAVEGGPDDLPPELRNQPVSREAGGRAKDR